MTTHAAARFRSEWSKRSGSSDPRRRLEEAGGVTPSPPERSPVLPLLDFDVMGTLAMLRNMLSWGAAVVALTMVSTASAAVPRDDQGFTPLFNGKDLTGWTTFLDPKKSATPDEIWSIKDGVIRCEGTVNGYLITTDEYENYVLKLDWRWPDAKVGNSGVFVHVVGPDTIWPKGVEAQLQNGRAGDFWLVGDFKLNVDSARQDPRVGRHYFRMKDDVEKPNGEWNTYEITCKGDKVTLVINGVTVNEGTKAELSKGKILLQSEGAPIEFRNIRIKKLD